MNISDTTALNEHQPPIVPALPVLGSIRDLFFGRTEKTALDSDDIYKVSSGGSAIYFALKLHNVKQGDEVLVPAYHCPAMVEPIIGLGATPIFYSITKEINIDIESISINLSANTKAILIPHFFGVKQDIKKLKKLCILPKSIGIIEDCAHAFFELLNIDCSSGHYYVGSLTKFFPVYDGGLLVANANIALDIKPLSFKQELRAIFNVFHDAVRYGRMSYLAWMFNFVSVIKRLCSAARNNPSMKNVEVDDDHQVLVHESLEYCASKISSYIVAHCDCDGMIEKRRYNYFHIIDKLKDVPEIDLSLNNLDSRFIPYMVIARLLKPEQHHSRLIANGLPIWRWENIYPSDCLVAKEYSKSIIQIPCHHELTQEEMTLLIDGIKRSLLEG